MRGLGLFLGMTRRQGGAAGAAPVNTVAPVVTGTGYVGYTLTTTDGTWTGSPAFTYQWQRSGVDIGGATLSTYVVTLADEGLPVRCVVTGTNGGGSASANSNAIEQWVPTDAGTVQGWWDAYSPATITIATGISAWASRGSLTNGGLSQSTGSRQPAYSATAWDGVRPCATFSFTNQNSMANGGSSDFARNTGGITVAAALSRVNSTADRVYFACSTPSLGLARCTPRILTGGDHAVVGRRLDADVFTTAAPVAFSTSARLTCAQYDHSNDQVRSVVDGTIPSWVSPFRGAGSTSDTQNAGISMGANGTQDNNYWDGKIAEIVQYGILLSDTDTNKLNGYLAWRWGVTANLPGGHPWKTTAPTP